jgi:hypothetical protein
LSDYLKEHADDPQAVSALIDSLKIELQAASVILSPLTLDLDGDGMVETTSKENSGRIAVGGIKRSNTCLTQTKEFALI